jgi:Na+/H+ antiporter NhaD/arsenite permease-like protein
MITIIIAIFIIGYLAIALEHPIKINKTASALLTGVLVWTVYAVFNPTDGILNSKEFLEFAATQIGLSQNEIYVHFVGHQLNHHLGKISEILFFLLGAMTIVELIDAHQGFKVITNRITTTDSRKLLWILGLITFFLSAALDNLTTAIVMVSLLRRLVHNAEQRKFFAGIVIIAANAGGAWSPIGDVTTTMLWIGGQISAVNIMKTLIIPSLVCLIVPLVFLSFRMKGNVERAAYDTDGEKKNEVVKGSRIMLFAGLGALLFVPVFKTVTHLPPYIGMLLGLGVVWVIAEFIHIDEEEEDKKPYTAIHALTRIDTPSVLFFLGILIAIGALESTHVLSHLSEAMNNSIGNLDVIAVAIGLASAVVDNVPLVAASQGMYDMATYPMDHKLWEFIAFTAGTGGSILIIGSAAGVAVMGMEKIDFIWYLKKISLLALMGFAGGALAYMAVYPIFAVH